MSFDALTLRQRFPVLSRRVRGKEFVYLDNAATTHKPDVVIEALRRFYAEEYATVHRGVYFLSEQATHAYEQVRVKAARFLGAARPEEIVFVRGTTEALNLVAYSWGGTFLKRGDTVLVSAMEHHSNIVPWQLVCERSGARLEVIPMSDRGELMMEEFERQLTSSVKIVAVTQLSNALGTLNPVREICALARRAGAVSVVDGAQGAPHLAVDVREMGCDFYACSGHKMYGPSGIGLLYGRHELLEKMPPWQGGGDMIDSVRFEKTEYAAPPRRFEAGTPAIAPVIGLGATLDFLASFDRVAAEAHERQLLEETEKRLRAVQGLRIIGTARRKAGAVSFVMENAHPHDIAAVADEEGVALRAGHHCAQPVMARFGVPATARASFAIYNTVADVEALVAALHKVNRIFS